MDSTLRVYIQAVYVVGNAPSPLRLEKRVIIIKKNTMWCKLTCALKRLSAPAPV